MTVPPFVIVAGIVLLATVIYGALVVARGSAALRDLERWDDE